jgi:virginiamycin B lyase
MRSLGSIIGAVVLGSATVARAAAPGLPAIQTPFAKLKPGASFKLGATADWVAITPDAVWVGATGPFSVQRIDPRTNRLTDKVELPGEPCAGLAVGFGALWVPVCGDHPGLARVDLSTRKLTGVTPLPAVLEEAGIAAGGDSLWLPLDARGTLGRLDPKTGRLRQAIALPAGSYNPLFAGGVVWVTSYDTAQLSAVDPATGSVLGASPTGPHPRFLIAGAGAVWTLNQGDGTVTRIRMSDRKPLATIPLGLPGRGGDIAFGDGRVFLTLSGVPLTTVRATDNRPLRQWVGPGGDSLRIGQGAVWLTNYKGGTVARFPLGAIKP